MTTTPKPVLKAGIIYGSDNGRLICIECAGMSAKYTGRDISGQKVEKIPYKETVNWFAHFGRPMACECGKTIYLMPE